MNRYVINQKFFKLADTYDVKDTNGNVRYKIKGKLISLGNKFWVLDAQDQEVLYIKQQLLTFLPKYEIYSGDNVVGVVKQQFSLFTKKLTVETGYGDMQIVGNPMAWDFRIETNGKVMAMVSKKLFKIADTYTLDVIEGNDALMIAIGVILDAIYHVEH